MGALLKISSLSGVMSRLLMVFLCEPGGFTVAQLAQLSGVQDLKSARLALKELQEKQGLVTCTVGPHRQHVWRLAGSLRLVAERLTWEHDCGAQPLAGAACATPGEGKSPRQPSTLQPAGENPQIERGEIPLAHACPAASQPAESLRRPGKNGQIGENPRVERSHLTTDSLNSDSSDFESLNSGKADSAGTCSEKDQNKNLLSKTNLLFGQRVVWNEVFSSTPPEEILGWLAQALQGRRLGKLERPWGFVYQGMLGKLRQKKPDRQFRDQPWEYLPEDYLAACGLQGGTQKISAREDPPLGQTVTAWPPGSQADDEPEDRSSPPEPFPDFPDRHIAQSWQNLIENLERRIKIFPLRQALKSSRPVGWDAASGWLTVTAASQEEAELLDDRLGEIVQQRLSPMLNRSDLTIIFVTA